MKIPLGTFLLGAGLAGLGGFLLGGCGTAVEGGGGYVDADFYGPVYGDPVYYGHPWYHHDDFVAHPPERHWAGGHPDEHRAGPAPAPHAAPAPRPSGGTTPEPRNQRG